MIRAGVFYALLTGLAVLDPGGLRTPVPQQPAPAGHDARPPARQEVRPSDADLIKKTEDDIKRMYLPGPHRVVTPLVPGPFVPFPGQPQPRVIVIPAPVDGERPKPPKAVTTWLRAEDVVLVTEGVGDNAGLAIVRLRDKSVIFALAKPQDVVCGMEASKGKWFSLTTRPIRQEEVEEWE